MNEIELSNAALAEYEKGNSEIAISMFTRAFDMCRSDAIGSQIKNNIASILMGLNRYQEALKHLETALDLHVHVDAVWNYSVCLLHNGRLREGMSLYKARYAGRDAIDAVHFPDLPIPQCNVPSEMRGRKVLVLNEQGFGDEIMFSRGFDVLLDIDLGSCSSHAVQCYPEMLPLFMTMHPRMKFFSDRSFSYDFVMGFDCWTCTGDLFMWSVMNGIHPAYENTVQPVGIMEPELKDGKNIGISLSCNQLSRNADKRSIDPDSVIPDLLAEGYRLTSLQKNVKYDKYDIVDYDRIARCNDFLDTALLIRDMDKVVTCDTVIAHLAGMLGKETDLLTTDYVDWRWKYVDDEGKSLLYPSIKVKKICRPGIL